MARSRRLEIDGREVEISNPGKLYFPESGLTKGALADYYSRHAGVLMRLLRERPRTQHRYPDGIAAEGFFQKNLPEHYPDWFDHAEMKKQGGRITYAVVNDAASLVYIANQGCITPHLALARRDRPEHPDRLIFDLDPSDDDFAKVQEAARILRRALERLELPVFVQTTGSRGLHLVVPLDRSEDFDAVRGFARELAALRAERGPRRLTAEQRRSNRCERVFLDILRNAYGQTAVAPYAVRAREGAPLATPLHWREAGASDLTPRRYTIKNIFRRLARTEDPWSEIEAQAVALGTARERLAAGS